MSSLFLVRTRLDILWFIFHFMKNARSGCGSRLDDISGREMRYLLRWSSCWRCSKRRRHCANHLHHEVVFPHTTVLMSRTHWITLGPRTNRSLWALTQIIMKNIGHNQFMAIIFQRIPASVYGQCEYTFFFKCDSFKMAVAVCFYRSVKILTPPWFISHVIPDINGHMVYPWSYWTTDRGGPELNIETAQNYTTGSKKQLPTVLFYTDRSFCGM